jgi:TPP-dependent pyruvate/acetoin dehydrogenase alpha subunit
MFDAQLYRSKDEVETWRQRDPISTLTARLREREWIDERGLEAIEIAVRREIDDAVDFAEASAWEPVEDLLVGVTAAGGPK